MTDGRDARAVSNWLLDWCDQNGFQISNLALQKILFFLHGSWLSRLRKPLVSDPFQAWDYGPVVRVAYDCFKHNGDNPIHDRAFIFDFFDHKREIARTTFSEFEKDQLSGLADRFARMPASALVELSHAPGGPWDLVWHGHVQAPNMVIDNCLILNHFSDSRDESVH